ncbi:MAG: flagellar type III secretion system pore protein FliP [Phycisphaerae bacterium]|nr:flagellar type III secretion system pore protein FliP [Phycisphaerae bacterium]
MVRNLLLLATVTATLLLAADVAAQTPLAPAPAGQTPAQAGPAVPEISDVLNVIDKATASNGQAANDWSAPVKTAIVFTFLALLPTVLVMMTSFTRIVIVLGFVRRALTTQSIPPTIAIIGLALFLTFFTMAPTFGRIKEQALDPYLKDQIAFDVAVMRGNEELKEFMIRQTRTSDLGFFIDLAGIDMPQSVAEVPNYIAIPAFAISEFRTAFEMGCLLFIPFLLVDLVISSILLSAGMMMLPPAMISLPFKIILFVLVDGWQRLAQTLVMSFSY